MNRKNIPTNIVRRLWSKCGGFCQNPNCNKYLFADVENKLVSLANVAHIIGHGLNGPRSEHELANYIDKDGMNNLIMLCLECHKIVDELEFRSTTVSVFIERFLANHSFIDRMEKLNIAMFDVDLKDGRSLRIFATNTYFFTEYTFDQIMAIDPAIDAIICSCPYASYTLDAKAMCIEHQIGLFKLKEFMGAIRKKGDDFLNYLLGEDKKWRIDNLKSKLEKASIPVEFQVYVFGSYIRKLIYEDIDLFLVYTSEVEKKFINSTIKTIQEKLSLNPSFLDITVCSKTEYQSIKLDYDNRTRVK